MMHLVVVAAFQFPGRREMLSRPKARLPSISSTLFILGKLVNLLISTIYVSVAKTPTGVKIVWETVNKVGTVFQTLIICNTNEYLRRTIPPF